MMSTYTEPGQGKWRLPGRGRKLVCAKRAPFYPWSHGLNRPCQWCGRHFKFNFEVGQIERVRFIEMVRAS